jgi:hypothetical protein
MSLIRSDRGDVILRLSPFPYSKTKSSISKEISEREDNVDSEV